jgi:thiamine biosynthesis lipoprotein
MNHSPSPQPNRRRFIALATGACGAAGWWRWQDGLKKVTQQSQALGANVSITALHADEATAQRALKAAFAELEQIESVMSLYRPESQICRLNRHSVLEAPDAQFLEVLRFAAQVAEKSAGAFDMTVQPLWALKGAAPDAAVLSKVGWQRVHLSPERVQMEKGMAITLNGIAQGYATDAALRVLRQHGVQHALIDAGELAGMGQSLRGRPWSIGIQHPRDRAAFAAMAELPDRALATSGDYETAFSGDFSRHHIIDPRSGLSPAELASVTIAAPDAMTADALSTAIFVLGSKRGLELLHAFPGTDALLISKKGQRHATAGFPLVA